MLLIWLYNDPSEEEVNAQLAQNNMQSMEFLLQQVDNGIIKKCPGLFKVNSTRDKYYYVWTHEALTVLHHSF